MSWICDRVALPKTTGKQFCPAYGTETGSEIPDGY